MSRGRPKEEERVKDKWTLSSVDYSGEKTTIKYDRSKNPNGPYSIEITPPKGTRSPKPKIEKRPYGKMPVFIAYKTSNRSNAKTKIKKFNQSIDYVISQEKLPGITKNAIILDIGVGESFEAKLFNKYMPT